MAASRTKSSTPAAPPDQSGRVIPDTQIAVHKLPGVNIALNFDGARIKATGGLPFERVTLGLRIENGELTVDPLTFHLALGDFALHARFNPFTQNSPPKLQGNIDIQHIDLHQLLGGPTMPAIVQETKGTAGGFITIDTSGVSLREFLAHMNGDVGVFVANGQMSSLLEKLAPLDVLEALGVYAVGDRPLPVNCFITRFDVKAGVATATTLLVKTPATTIVGSGNINFGSETLYLNVKPYNNSFAPVSLRTPVDIQGTLKKPAFHLETGNLVARLGAAAGLGVLFPPAALLPLIDTGLGENNACRAGLCGAAGARQRRAQIGQQRAAHKPRPSRRTRRPPSRRRVSRNSALAGFAQRVRHLGAALAHRARLPGRAVARGLVLDLGIELGAEQDDVAGDVEPHQQHDHRAQ